jgi:arabinogalactan oligomer/maltooligosaccharide transport system substrate-binding protein
MKKIGVCLLLVMTMFLLTGCNGDTRKSGDNAAVNNNQDNNSTDNAAVEPATESPSADGQEQAASDDENKQEVNSDPVQITIWHDKEDTVAAVLQAELDKLAPEIVVTLVKKEGLTDALKLVGNDPNAAPDMYFFAHDKIGVYAEMGILAPITDFIPEETFKDYIDVTVSAATYKGEIYQLPIYYETLLFMYNKDLMSEADVPATTEELYSYMKEHTDGERYGFVEQHSTPYYSVPWLHGFGAYIINEAGEIGLQTPEAIQALTYHKKFVDLMPGESDYNTINILFFEGKADSIIGGPWLVPSIRTRGINLGFAPMPTVDDTGLPLSPYSGTQGLHVLKVAAETKAAAITKVLNQLTGTGIGIAMANASGCAPANSLCYEDDSVKQDEMVMMMKATAENAVPMPNIPEMDVMWTVTGNMLTAINMSGGDPTEEAKRAAEEAKDLISAMQ